MTTYSTSNVSPDEIGSPGGPYNWNDMLGSISAARVPTSNAPQWTNITLDGFTTQALAFDTNDYIDLFVQTSHGAKLNEIIDNHIHWTIASNDAGDEFQFQLTGVGAGVGDSFQSIGTLTSGDYVLQGDEAGVHNLLEIGDIPAINTTVSSIFILRLTRIAPDDGDDTAENIYVLFNDSHMKFDQSGSRQEYVK